MSLFFDSRCTRETRGYFENFILTHLNRWAVPDTVMSRSLTTCSGCGLPAPDQLLAMLAEQGRVSYVCPFCEREVRLITQSEAPEVDDNIVNQMDREADAKREAETAQSVIRGKRATGVFDVFLCHNSYDKPIVKQIGERLKCKGILPWLDEWELRPGVPWQRSLEKQIKSVKAAAVFVGRRGLGPWQDREQEAFIRQFVQRDCPVIPALLHGCPKKPELPPLLEGFHWVDFRKMSPDPIEQLIFGITGKQQS